MAVDIWPPRLKIANVGRTSLKKKIKHFLQQAPWEISKPCQIKLSVSWKNNEKENKRFIFLITSFVCEAMYVPIHT